MGVRRGGSVDVIVFPSLALISVPPSARTGTGTYVPYYYLYLPCSFVYVWDAATSKLVFKLPGHNGSVNEVSGLCRRS